MAESKADIETLLDLSNRLGLLAMIAVVTDVALELRNDAHMLEAQKLADRLFETLRYDTHADDACTELWRKVRNVFSSTDVKAAKECQALVRRITGTNRRKIAETETILAALAEKLLRGQRQKKVLGTCVVLPEHLEENLNAKHVCEIVVLRRKVDLIAKKGTLLALLHRVTEISLDAAMKGATTST